MKRRCLTCKKDISKTHCNRKRCKPCAAKLAKSPVANLTPRQEKIVRKWAGKIYAIKVAEKAGISKATLVRWARDNGVSMNALSYKKETIEQVIEYYVEHGRAKTEKKFPNVKVRSIVERYAHAPRQIRWTDDQLIDLARFAGLASFSDQAEYFNRPMANAGSIRAAWAKKFNSLGRHVNGLPLNVARHYVKRSCPFYETPTYQKNKGFIKLVIWMDFEKHLRDDVTDDLRNMVKSMVKFQKWLHGNNPKRRIEKILSGDLRR